ncbi:hypothetical protein [Nonomuraea endophytica]|uniref:Integral membrane protein n=1 Tax=Nonomuraea endophytica TaxID=714136 RepID=A0A7W8ACP6_9ACTN|nr:hypothetical protein [Nonomuraea endophytica]MBB5083867.1 hypothetical protein [Nonomuraea endophytica]
MVTTTAPAVTTTDAKLLRFALRLDAIGTGANGLLYLGAAAVFGGMFGLPAALLYPIGVFLSAFGAALLVLGARPVISKAAVGVVMAVNVLWVLASVEALIAGWFPLTALGTALVIAQAAAVAGFTALQYAGLRRA